MINVFPTTNMRFTPFGGFHEMDLPFLRSHDIHLVSNAKDANVIVSQHFKQLKPLFLKYGKKKKYLIWTLEPRFNTHNGSIKKFYLGQMVCHVMNIYTGDVFVSPISFHSKKIDRTLSLLPEDYVIKNKTLVGLMSFYKGMDTEAVMLKGRDVDLIKKRVEIALYGHKRGLIDVYGKGWPEGVSKEDSREGDWVERKKTLMDQYDFNLCFENTAAPRYCTEKIWDSIENYCLPIYYGNDTEIYDRFPRQSFIDYADLNTPERLFDFIKEMKDQEYITRLNKCIEVYNKISAMSENDKALERAKSLNKIVEKLRELES